jgi:hypothetical protein
MRATVKPSGGQKFTGDDKLSTLRVYEISRRNYIGSNDYRSGRQTVRQLDRPPKAGLD